MSGAEKLDGTVIIGAGVVEGSINATFFAIIVHYGELCASWEKPSRKASHLRCHCLSQSRYELESGK